MRRPTEAISGAVRRARRRAGWAVPKRIGELAREQATFDWWLENLYGDALEPIDRACAGAGPEALRLFAGLDDDLWTVLLSREYSSYPNIRSLLPDLPDPELQVRWNGRSGFDLLAQSKDFYVKARGSYARHGGADLATARVLDFGCGWGRLVRFFARDVEPGRLCGCDPVEEILELCRRTRVPAELARSDFSPERLPFDEPFDLVFAFSVFTHLAESTHERCLDAIHAGMRPGGILVVTIRPPGYLRQTPMVRPLLDSLGPDPLAAMASPRYLFIAHAPDTSVPTEGDEVTFGETVIGLSYVRERWAPRFELLDVGLLASDMHQVVLTLRRS
jgi:SAM-dependent methyltransferase